MCGAGASVNFKFSILKLNSDIFNNELMSCPYKYKSPRTPGGDIMT